MDGAQFAFLRDNGIAAQQDMAVFESRTEETLANLTKQRTILNVRKKKRRRLYDVLADAEALGQAKAFYSEGVSGMEAEFNRQIRAERKKLVLCQETRDLRLFPMTPEQYQQFL